jgi:hypothetical protein
MLNWSTAASMKQPINCLTQETITGNPVGQRSAGLLLRLPEGVRLDDS